MARITVSAIADVEFIQASYDRTILRNSGVMKVFRSQQIVMLVVLLATVATTAAAQTPVSVVRPDTGQARQTLNFSGNLIARRSASLSPQVAGQVEQVHSDVGDRVEAGDVMLGLDPNLAALEVARAEAAVEQARAALVEAGRLVDEGRRLVVDRFVPDTEVRAREANLAQAEAALARAQSELEIEQEQLARHDLRAPFAGVVSQRYTELGEWVTPGTTVLDLVADDQLWLDVRVPQQYWADMADELVVRAVADVAPDRFLDARVHARVPVNDPMARTFLLRLLIQDESGSIIPGMSARVSIELPGSGSVTLVPRDAIIRYPDGTTTLWVVPAGSNQARQRQVDVVRNLGDQVELTDELAAGDRVVVRGNEVLSEGETVRIDEGGN
jgi:membrane fusion protein, multidrug efflux system